VADKLVHNKERDSYTQKEKNTQTAQTHRIHKIEKKYKTKKQT
jgi:hypothetical protein